jgi:hypothetical protein
MHQIELGISAIAGIGLVVCGILMLLGRIERKLNGQQTGHEDIDPEFDALFPKSPTFPRREPFTH